MQAAPFEINISTINNICDFVTETNQKSGYNKDTNKERKY